jgi:uncharacterized protein (AIM24 family)
MPHWDIQSQDLLNYVEVYLDNESVRTEAGAMRYHQGPITMESKLPSVGSFIKSRLSGEKIFRPVYSGSGKLVLEPSFENFFKLELKNERYVLDRGAYWASDMGVKADIKMNNISTGMLSGEGLIQTAVSGTGTVIVRAPGPVEVIDLDNDQLVVDGSFAVARSASLDFTIEQSTRSLFGTVTSGEVLVNVLRGTGRVYLAPVPNQTLMLQQVILSSMQGMLAKFNPKSGG